MRWPLRRKPAGRRDRNQVPALRVDRTRVQVLEHEVFGIVPPAGSAAAALIGMEEGARRLREAMAAPVDREACPHGDMVETPVLGSARVPGVCVRCGAHGVQGDDGGWVFP